MCVQRQILGSLLGHRLHKYMNYCKCQCGKEVAKTWFHGHNRKGTTFTLSKDARDKMRQSKLGKLNPRYGKPGTRLGAKHTDEAKVKIREARAKQVFSPESGKKCSETLKRAYATGKRDRTKCAFYIDGRHKGKVPIKQSFEYRLWRTSVFKRDNYICQTCGQRGGELQADHIKPQSAFPELRFDINNGRTLCRPCHQKTETWGIRFWNNKKTSTNICGTQS